MVLACWRARESQAPVASVSTVHASSACSGWVVATTRALRTFASGMANRRSAHATANRRALAACDYEPESRIGSGRSGVADILPGPRTRILAHRNCLVDVETARHEIPPRPANRQSAYRYFRIISLRSGGGALLGRWSGGHRTCDPGRWAECCVPTDPEPRFETFWNTNHRTPTDVGGKSHAEAWR